MAALISRSTRARFALACLVLLLAGCGGGSAEVLPEEEQIVRPRPCADRPELCR
jgi:hypothetical protein